MSDAADSLGVLMAQKRPAEVIIVPVDWLPRDGRHWLFHPDSSALAISWPMFAAGRAEQAMQEVRVPFRGLRPGERVALRGGPVRAPSGASAPPAPPDKVWQFVADLDRRAGFQPERPRKPVRVKSDVPRRPPKPPLPLSRWAPRDPDVDSFAHYMEGVQRLPEGMIRARLEVLDRLAAFLGKPLRQASEADLLRWRQGVVDGRPLNTQLVCVCDCRAFFRWCVIAGNLADTPAARLTTA